MPSVYRQFGVPSSYAVRHFEKDKKLRVLLSDILRDATIARREKCDELAKVGAKYHKLMNDYRHAECELQDVKVIDAYGMETYDPKHKPRQCGRCAIQREAQALSIAVHEWPVSEDPYVAKATIFELQAPNVFSSWRDLGLYVQDNILKFKSAHPQPVGVDETLYGLPEHAELSELLEDDLSSRRLLLKSKTKGKYGMVKKNVSTLEEKDVCIKSALNYAYFDGSLHAWSTELDTCGMRTQEYQYPMPARSKLLEPFLLKTLSAPDGLSINESLVSHAHLISFLS